ncbi:hypothetical protein [Legionella maioricensis]|uniref:Secreted protein n=1 Tax=Legionella maioricensis TaxID=2896528 RepID=A0A9X2CYI8_9GAMM|nr:hypothetical protein [Legionella maioricensis]MCL9682617.1 hypothetical protein [Legionella maioricensis]MCL9687336.1 hypothetical protein [Legionella maioricensis]
MNKLIMAALFTVFNTVALADSVIVTQTQTWESIPITVNPEKHTYITVEGPVPTGNYYYTYSGYRCVREKIEIAGTDAIIYHSGVEGGGDIYCYPE